MLRVTGVYLIAAWAAIQVADTVLPNLGMPSWAVRLVIILAALALPIVVALAWTFDLTREGVQRTPSPADGSERAHAGVGYSGWIPAAGGLALIFLLAVFGWWLARPDEDALDADLVAVLPFRVAGADASLGYLREGLMDLLAATLTGRDGVPASVSPRTLTQLLRERIGSLDTDASEAQAFDIARAVGAGRVLAGELVGAHDNLTITARLYDVATGEEVTRARFSMHPDSLHRIVDRIAARLIAAEAGLGEDRLTSVTTTSLPALRAYLDGARAFRRGDHSGAMDAWDRALDLDSTFALAALGLSRASSWTLVPSRHSDRAFGVAWSGRGALGEADRAFLEAVSPRYPLVETFPELIEASRRAVDHFPHDPDLRFLLGDAYLHYGAAAGLENVLETARTQLASVIAADSTHFEALIHLYDIAQEDVDSASMRRYGDLIISIDSTSPTAIKVRHDRSPDLFDLDTLGAAALVQLTADGWFGRPDTTAIDATFRAIDRASSSSDEALLKGFSYALAAWEGRGGRLWQMIDDGRVSPPPAQRLRLALFATADTQRAASEAAAVRRALVELQSAEAGESNDAQRIAHQCMLAHWEAGHASSSAAERHAADLKAWAAGREGAPTSSAEQLNRNTALLCADLVLATVAVRSRAASAVERLHAVDSRLAEGLPLAPSYYEAANLHTARVWRALRQPERALAAVRRRIGLAGYVLLLGDALGEEARILDDLGRRTEAIEAYTRFLGWRARADGLYAEQTARDRARLTALLAERR